LTSRLVRHHDGAILEEAMRDLSTWKPCAEPRPGRLSGRLVTLDAYRSADADALWACFGGTAFNDLARYFPNPDYDSVEPFRAWLDAAQAGWHTMVFRRVDTRDVCGMASYMRMDPANGVVEVGSVCHGQSMQRSALATEAHYLMAKHVFDDLGYRRYEWKLNNENLPSHAAAVRMGFSFEGIFRNHILSRGKNRDTAWYAMIDAEWPVLRRAFEDWLAPDNFDAGGHQRVGLGVFNRRTLEAGPVVLHRSFGDADRIEIEGLQRDAYARTQRHTQTTPIPLEWDYARVLEACEVWLARHETGALDGVLLLRREDDALLLESVATSSRASGSGLGSAMLEATIARGRALGQRHVRLITNALNPAAQWYRRRGFAVIKEEMRGKRRVLHMGLDITPA
jgi:RimJ/RimL family protein N-acetyltransferase